MPRVSSRPTADHWRSARIRTYHGRHRRMTERMRHTLDELGPRYALRARPATERPLVLEVGCGDGEAALAFARAHPGADLLAVDVHGPGAAHLIGLRDADGPPNLYVERTDALDLLDDRLGSGSLAGVHVFFPDPWPKARHHKRRLIRPDVLDLLADRLEGGAPLLVATDWAGYADWCIDHLDAHPRFEGGPARRPPWRPVTRYEQAGIDEGRAIADLAYRRR